MPTQSQPRTINSDIDVLVMQQIVISYFQVMKVFQIVKHEIQLTEKGYSPVLGIQED